MKYLTHFSRVFVGVLFIISGMIKLNDPMGFAFKLEEYFSMDVLNLPFLEPLALPFALIVVIVEVVLGVTLLLGFRTKLTLWLLMLMIVFFTFLTFYSAYFNKVTDCGCFGDAVKLTPWGSFTKDIVLLVFISILMAGQQYIRPILSDKQNLMLLTISLLFCVWFGNHVLNHLPVKDFRAYAIGKSIPEGMKTAEELGLPAPEFQVMYTMKDTITGEMVEVTDKAYIDDKWWEKKEWKIVSDLTKSVLIKEGYEAPIHDFSISTDNGDFTDHILMHPTYLLVISYDLEKTDVEGFKKFAQLGWDLEGSGVSMIAMTSTAGAEVENFRHEVQAPFEFAVTDKTTLKTMVRANPGLIMIKNGTIVGKWHHNDTPSVDEINALR